MIPRTIQKQLLEDLEQFPAVAITGARQTGKTTLARQMGEELASSVYLDLEHPEDVVKLQEPVYFFREYQDQAIILDEIHRLPKLFPTLRAIIDEYRRPGRFILLGSASPGLIRDSSESLAGRISYNELHPLNLPETAEICDFKTLLMRGGFPGSLRAPSVSKSHRWRVNFLQTYIERELPALGLDSDIRIMRKLLVMLAHTQSQVLNTQSLSNALGVSRPTVARYIDFLEKAYLLYRIEPWFVNIKKRLVKSPKVYLADSGLFHTLLGIGEYQALVEHPSVGASWEGFVIQQTRSVLPQDMGMWFFRTYEGAEADIVLTRHEVPLIAAEIKWTNAPKVSKGFRNVIEDLGTKENYVITPESGTWPAGENIRVISLKGWLEKIMEKSK